MAQTSRTLFYFYRRYRWTAQNFNDLQSNLLSASLGLGEGIAKKSVVSGLRVSFTNLAGSISAGIAVGPSGNLNVTTSISTVNATAPSTLPRKSLIVIREIDTDSNNITAPTSPFATVPLNNVVSSQVLILNGTESLTPSYPSVGVTDVILAGFELSPGATAVTMDDIDINIRDRVGKNSDIGENKSHDYIVGTSRKNATHSSFARFCADLGVLPKSTVLITDDETIDMTPEIQIENLRIEFLPGVTLQAGTAATGCTISAQGIQFVSPRLKDFSLGFAFAAGGEYCSVMGARYKNVTDQIDDATTSGVNQSDPFSEA